MTSVIQSHFSKVVILFYVQMIHYQSDPVLTLENLLHACEIELNNTDKAINFGKSSCLVYVLIHVMMQRAPALRA